MATFASRLADWRWLFMEKGLMHVHSELQLFANTTSTASGGVTLTGAATYGAVDMQTQVVTAVVKKVNPAGEFNVGNSGANPPVVKAPPTNFQT